MILAANRNSKEFISSVRGVVGERYSFLQRLRMGGVGSSQMVVKEYSVDLSKCFGSNQDRKFVILELCEKGMIVYIKNHINDYVWLVPYYQLSIFKSDFYSVHSGGNYIKIGLESLLNKNNLEFLKKLERAKLENTGDRGPIK
jgi:hypothetical protein